MNSEKKLHKYQKEIIKKLVLKNGSRFNQLLIDGLKSEHMNYHLKQLTEISFVTKEKNKYFLTDLAKDFSNLLDHKMKIVEKQPKTSIIIRAARKNKNGEVEHLLNKRLRQPYFGKVGRITGKVLFGETFQLAAARELYEETGLKAKNFTLEEIYRKMRKRDDGVWVQDVIFYIFFVTNLSGKLIKKTEFQENFWITTDELKKKKLDVYDDLDLEERLKPKKLTFKEHSALAKGF